MKNIFSEIFKIFAFLAVICFASTVGAQDVHNGVCVLADFEFDSVKDTSGNYTGTLKNGAELVNYNNTSVLKLGQNNGYFDFGQGFGEVIARLDSFSFSTNVFIPASTDLTRNGGFVWNFANSDNMASSANGNLFFRAGNSRYSISKTHWAGESSVVAGIQLPKDRWINVTYIQHDNEGKIYIDGELSASGSINIKPKELGATAFNFLGRSCYAGDDYLISAQYDNFIVCQGALGQTDINAICGKLGALNNIHDSIVLLQAMEKLEIPGADFVRSNLILPSVIGSGVNVSWVSSNPAVVSEKGMVSRPAIGSDPVKVKLTATLVYHNVSNTKVIDVVVLPKYSDAISVLKDIASLKISGNVNNVRSAVHLPITTNEGSMVTWESGSPEYLNSTGKVLKLSPYGSGKKKVLLTATLKKGEAEAKRVFEVWVAEEENRDAYLFAYFTGNTTDGEQIRFAVSSNGVDYIPLNNGNRIISSDTISIKKGVRDPHILRGEDGETFYMVVTDMKSAEGWSSNRGIVLLKSNDLVSWTHSTVHFPARWPETWGNVLRVWAPQTIYDLTAKKYLVYFSLYTGDNTCPYDRIYYCYANNDFTDLEGEPQLLFDRGTATIDGDIVYSEADSLYYMFFKNESIGGISQVTAKTLTHLEGTVPGSQWGAPSPPLQQTNKAVEGSGAFRLINSDEWILMYDCYTSGHYQYCVSGNLKDFTFVKDNYDIHARHGTTISISKEEMERLIVEWPAGDVPVLPQGARNPMIKKNGIRINTGAQTIDIAVHHGTDLKNFDPGLYANPGTLIKPEGPQDFSSGSIGYSFTLDGETVMYTVFAKVEVNPVLPGFHADPEILYSEKTGRFYIYPTSDGYPGWGGYSFDVFSSPDLVNWTNEGTILDLSTDQVNWATGNAWAPCIEEIKHEDGSYRYFFYFSGNAGIKKIGVAMANDPAGPFLDSGAPMISELPAGVGGQLIDGDVFTDPVSGKGYFYWGNGFLAVAELNDDMVSIDNNTIRVITPAGGTLNDYAYREGTYVFYRNGLYYFLWSVDDTGSDNYHVAYGTSGSPTGPVNVAASPIVIKHDAGNKIYGTGHNSVLQIPGKDEWYIVYHRINENYLSNGPGYHREVCIDKLEFNPDGTIKKVIPTRKGIDPVDIRSTGSSTVNIFDFHDIKFPEGEIVIRNVFDLTGRLVHKECDHLANGIYIVCELYENGEYKTYKHIGYLQ
ncbi:MAG: family 43 glycosylhydrolase [Bacteroidales bacterium]|nr:family 43 glycosylhydrolase [Bacteroidales bacterium]